jgi:hypothetical protein
VVVSLPMLAPDVGLIVLLSVVVILLSGVSMSEDIMGLLLIFVCLAVFP